MNDLRKVIADNICALRTEARMTQLDLAEVLNYTDKAVSKWERGEAIPDVTVLKRIADHFGVTVDYLLRREHTAEEENARHAARITARNRFFITLISAASVWVFATLAFFILWATETIIPPPWLAYIYAIPVSSIVVLVLNSIWGKRWLNMVVISVLLWSIILSIYLTVLTVTGINLWLIFIIGAPGQVIILFIPGINLIKSPKKEVKEIKKEDNV